MWLADFFGMENVDLSGIYGIPINTHSAVLDAFITQIRAILNKKPTFTERMRKAKKKSDEHNKTSG